MRTGYTGSSVLTRGVATRQTHGTFLLCALVLILVIAGCTPALHWTNSSDVYVVRKGDTLYSIAFRNQLDYHELAGWNNIPPPYTIYPGEKIRLLPSSYTAPRPAPTTQRTARATDSGDSGSESNTSSSEATSRPVDSTRAEPQRELDGRGQTDQWLWPAKGRVIRGYAPDKNSQGINIGGQVGEPIHATAPGKVVYSGHGLKGYGRLIIIMHDGEYLSAYGHNRELGVKEGDQVQADQVIARMGRGPKNKPMLHFEIRLHGEPVDPLSLLPHR